MGPKAVLDNAWQQPSEIEQDILDALSSPDASKKQFGRLIGKLPASQRFVLKDAWMDLSRDASTEDWRRLEAYKLYVERCLTYPRSLESFKREAIVPLGVDAGRMVDMTMGSFVPVDRKSGDLILMAQLPISTAIGPAAVYLVVNRSENRVEQVAVYPDTVEASP